MGADARRVGCDGQRADVNQKELLSRLGWGLPGPPPRVAASVTHLVPPPGTDLGLP